MIALWLAIAALADAQIATFIMQRKRIMTLEESLKGLETFNADTVKSVLDAIATIPALIVDLTADTTRKVLDAYIAEHPEAAGSITDERIVEHIQTVTEQSKALRGLTASIQLPFDQMKVSGDPNPPAEPVEG